MRAELTKVFGRRVELASIDAAVAAAGDGLGAALVLSGEPGVGKSTLLRHAASSVPSDCVRAVSGVEAESPYAYAALHRLLLGDLHRLERLTPRHRAAMAVALGLEEGAHVSDQLVGLALLSLLADIGTTSATMMCVDDAHWLDAESLRALAFAARRIHAEGVVIVFAVRAGEPAADALAGLRTIDVTGLDVDDATELLRDSIGSPLSETMATRIVDATAGNPLALIDLGRELSAAELSGAVTVHEPIAVGARLHEHFRQRVDALGPSARAWLVVAASEPSGETAVIHAAARALAIDPGVGDEAETAGIVTIRRTVRFRHPLVRSAAYGGATADERRAAHEALAGIPVVGADRLRRSWHLAAASAGHDDELAGDLERCADEAGSRGGHVSCAALLTRAAELTSAPSERARRLLAAAERAFAGGSLVHTQALLDRCVMRDLDGEGAGRALTLRAWTDVRTGMPNAEERAVARCLEAAARFGDRSSAGRTALVAACEHAVLVARLDGDVGLRAVAEAIDRSGCPDESDPVVDGFLAAFVAIVGDRRREAVDLVRAATDALAARDLADGWRRNHTVIATSMCSSVWDWERRDVLLERAAQAARREGALSELEMILYTQSMADTNLGDLPRAERRLVEGHQLRASIGGLADDVMTLYRHPVLVAWTGTDPDLSATAALIIGAGESLGNGAMVALSRAAIALDHLARGRYQEACAAADAAMQGDPISVNTWVAPILVEAAVRSGDDEHARATVIGLARRAEAASNSWSLGVLARALALVDQSGEAEHAYRRSISLLTPTPARGDLARSHLVYGEWLRRRKRRSDARTHLRVAHTMFVEMGAATFAERARIELAATGERARARNPETVRVLTPQEDHIARLAAEGMTNAEIGSRLYISAKTVDYHLGKIYRKLGIESRRDLRRFAR